MRRGQLACVDVRLRGDFGSEESICCSSIWLGDGFAGGSRLGVAAGLTAGIPMQKPTLK